MNALQMIVASSTNRFVACILPALALVIFSSIPAPAQPGAKDNPAPTKRDGKKPAKVVVVTEAENNRDIVLKSGEELVVQLPANKSTGYSWNIVWDSASDLLTFKPHPQKPEGVSSRKSLLPGASSLQVFRFKVAQNAATFERALWLRFLLLRPFEKGVEGAKLFQVRVIIAPRDKRSRPETP